MFIHNDEVVRDKQIGEGIFGIVFKGTFKGNDVAVDQKKDIDVDDAMDELAKEVGMLDTFRCDQIVNDVVCYSQPRHDDD